MELLLHSPGVCGEHPSISTFLKMRQGIQVTLAIFIFMLFRRTDNLVISVTLYAVLMSYILRIYSDVTAMEWDRFKEKVPITIKQAVVVVLSQLISIAFVLYLTYVLIEGKKELFKNYLLG